MTVYKRGFKVIIQINQLADFDVTGDRLVNDQSKYSSKQIFD